jgi:hypothetical protein
VACTGRFAEAWQFASFFCTGVILSNVDDSGGAANAFLTDSTVNFLAPANQVEAGVGMVLYNTTSGTSGPVTAVTAHTITATGVTWDDGDGYRIVLIDAIERSTIEHYLNIAASDLHVAMAQSGMCDCTLASWATGYLQKLNIIDAAAYYQCRCGQPSMTNELRGRYLDWCNQQLQAIREGKLELCDSATGADFPAIGWASQSWTDWSAAEIIFDYEQAQG